MYINQIFAGKQFFCLEKKSFVLNLIFENWLVTKEIEHVFRVLESTRKIFKEFNWRV